MYNPSHPSRDSKLLLSILPSSVLNSGPLIDNPLHTAGDRTRSWLQRRNDSSANHWWDLNRSVAVTTADATVEGGGDAGSRAP